MSKTIDERVVSMQFDNKQFEANVKTSMGTLEKLKQSLNFKGMSKGLEDVNAAAKNCNLAPMSNAVENVRLKFSALEVMAVTALTNITNSAVNAGKRIVSALTIDPVKTGFSEYETQINAVQTILANTQSKGTTLDDVNMALDTLNAYADKTIYNFTEMTRNIGTFTAAGIDLDTSVNAIQGIANLAAVSGSNAQQASTAMYQLSQALASGTVKLMDWNSVVNAGMGGQVFQDALKETARAHGIAVDSMIEKNGSFRESLSEGWITSEILTETLQKFTLTTEGLTDAQIEANREMLRGKGYTEEQIDEIFKLGETATNAATKVKTFTQLWDTLKEAAQSGWTQTWELIVGDFEEAKELWTNVSNAIGEIIGNQANNRNEVLKGALVSKWDLMIEKINAAGVSTEQFNEQGRKTLERWGFDVDELIKKHGSLENVFRSGKISSKILEEALDELCDTAVDLSEVEVGLKFGAKGEDVKALQQRLKALGYNLGEFGEGGVDGIIGKVTEEAIKAFQEAEGLEITGVFDEETIAAMEKAGGSLSDLRKELGGLIDEIDKLGGRELLIESFANIWTAITKPLKAVKEAWDAVFGEIFSNENKASWLYNLIDAFHSFTEKLIISDETAEMLKGTFVGLFEGLKGGFGLIKNGIGVVRDWIRSFWELPFVQEKVAKFKESFSGILDIVKKIIGPFSRVGETITLEDGTTKVFSFIDAIKEVKNNVTAFLSSFSEGGEGIGGKIFGIFGRIIDFFKNFKENIGKYFGEAGTTFDNIKTKISDFATMLKEKLGDKMGSIIALGSLVLFLLLVKKIKDAVSVIAKPFGIVGDLIETTTSTIGSFGTSLKSLTKSLGQKAKSESIKAIAIAIGILAASLWLVAQIPADRLWPAFGAIAALAGVLTLIAVVLGKMPAGDFGKMSTSLLGLSGALILFALAAKAMGGVEWSAMGKCGVVLAAIIGALILMSKLKVSGEGFNGFGKMMMQLSIGLLILSVAIKTLGGMDTNVLIQGGLAVAVFLGMMVGMMAATKLLSKDMPKFGTTMLALTSALLLLALVVKIFGSMDTWTLIQGGFAVLLFLGMMVGIMAATKLLNKDMPKFGATMLGIGAALLMMSMTILIMGKMDPATAIKGGIALIGLLGIIAIMMATTKLLNKDLPKFGAAMFGIGTALLMMAGAIAVLALIPADALPRAVIALAAMSIMLTLLMLASEFAKGDLKTIIGISVAIAIIAATVAALTFIDPAKLAAPVTALVVLMGMMAILLASTKSMTTSIGPLIAIAGIIAILAGAIILMSNIPVETALPIVASLSALVLSLSIACTLLSAVPIVGALMAVANLAILIAGLTAIVMIMGGIAQIPGAQWLVSEGGAFLESIGNAIGSFIGGIGAGIGTALSAGLPEIATNLSTFMDNLQPFLDKITGLDETSVNGVKALAEMLLMLTGAALLDAIANWITGGSSLADFSAGLVPFGDNLKDFADSIADLSDDDMDKMGKVGTAIEKLVEIADKVPETGGIAQAIMGTPDLVNFATGLEALGPAITTFSGSISELSQTDIDRMPKVATAVEKLVEIANNVPATDGWLQKLIGVPNMVAFAEGLAGTDGSTGLGSAIATFSGSLTEITDDDITKMDKVSSVITKLVEIANAVPATDGLAQKITGVSSISSFATELSTFGGSIKTFSENIAGVEDDDISRMEKVGNAAKKLIDVAVSLKDYDDKAWLNTNLTEFAGEMKNFGDKMAEYYKSIQDIDTTKFNGVMTIASRMKILAGSLEDVDTSTLETFADDIWWFGDGLNTMSTDIADVDVNKITTAVDNIKDIIALTKDIKGADFTSLSGFGTALGELGNVGVDKFVAAFDGAIDRIKAAGGKMITEFLKGASEKKANIVKTCETLVSDAVTAIRDKWQKFYDAGKYVVSGFANGITANGYKARDAAEAIADSVEATIRAALMINSPSKVMIPIGGGVPEGLALGMHKLGGLVKDAGEDVANNALDGTKDAIARVADAINSDIDAQPTIRPVLDLSEVTAGAGAISSMLGMNPSIGVMSNLGSISSAMNGRQNGANDDVITAISKLGKQLGGMRGDTYTINGVTYDDGSNVSEAVKSLVRAAKVERRR